MRRHYEAEEVRKLSRVDVIYVWERLRDTVNNCESEDDWIHETSRFMAELSRNFEIDTGHKIDDVSPATEVRRSHGNNT